MGHAYRAVQWNRQKRRYDLFVAAGVLIYLAAFFAISIALRPEASPETLLLRALGTCAFLILHVILAIGPLARIDARWLPLLYNRRHLGVVMCGLALLHGAFAILQFHGFSDVNPIVSVFTANTRYGSLAHFPFQPLGAIALVILVLMAATSHDFWLSNLTAPVWKTLHMLVYVAYALLVAHVGLGIVQAETSPILWIAVALGASSLLILHVVAAYCGKDATLNSAEDANWLDACAVDDVPEGRAKVVLAGGERVAIFRDRGHLSALSGVCQHQNGPLGEGRVKDGVVVCPWHGYEYRAACGCSPEPFQERVPTFRIAVRGSRVWLDPEPLPLGTETEPIKISAGETR